MKETSSALLAEARDEAQRLPKKSLVELLDDAVERFPHQEAVVSLHQSDQLGLGGENKSIGKPLSWTYSQMKAASELLASNLSSRGIDPGSQIVAILYNEAEWALIFWAAIRLSCQFVPLDPRLLTQREDATHVFQKVSPAAIFVSDSRISQMVEGVLDTRPSQPRLKCTITTNESRSDLLEGWETLSQAMIRFPNSAFIHGTRSQIDDTLLVLFTSGTESLPKACPHSTTTIGTPAQMLVGQWGLTNEDSLCQHLPSFHVFNIVLSLAFWLAGGSVIFPSPSFNPALSLDAIQLNQRTYVPCVPTMLQALVAHAAGLGTFLRPPFAIILGGAPITPDILDLCKALAPERIVPGYGTTEGVATLMNLIDAKSFKSVEGDVCLGKPRAGAGVRICHPGSRTPLSRGQVGELHQGGYPVIGGYLGASIEQSAAFYEEGGMNWMATGDQGYMDKDGNVYLFGRYKDLIIRGGENISPVKIENFLGKLPGVNTAYVVGVPDSVAGEVPVAVITRDEIQNEMPAHMLQSTVAAQLGRSFSPTVILDLKDDLGMDSYPTTTSGKIRKPVLRQLVVTYLEKLGAPDSSSIDLAAELAGLWSLVSGLRSDEIGPDTPIQAFADSIMIMQFLHLLRKTRLGYLTMHEVTISNTARKQAELLVYRDECKKGQSSQSQQPDYLLSSANISQYEQVASVKLKTLGLDWEDVQEVIPMTDYMKRFARSACRPSSWNLRATLVADPSIDLAQIYATLRLWLERHPLLRATTVKVDDDLELYLVLRMSEPWLKLQIIHGDEVECAGAVELYKLNDPAFDRVNPATGPLCKVTIVKIRDSSNLGLVMHYHHAIFDGLSLFAWATDLKDLLRGKGHSQIQRLPYHVFAADYERYRKSSSAEKAVDYHVQRLQGLSKCADALWPPQKVPGWIKGDAQGWAAPEGWTGKRELLDKHQSIGVQGLNCSIRLSQLPQMRSELAISPATIAKCACVLINLRLTGQEEALFTGVDSGRSWPSGSHNQDGNPFEIDGPTMTFYANRIRISSGETAQEVLTRLQSEQAVISAHAHAPLDAIKNKLIAAGSTGRADVGVLEDLFHRQTFNWLMRQYSESDADPIRLTDCIGRTDIGFMWFPSLLPDNVLHLNVTWDDAQLRADEVYDITSQFMCAVAWLSDPDNMGKPVSECRFKGYEGIQYWNLAKAGRQ